MANPLRQFDQDEERYPIPPKGKSEADKAARRSFWIDHGNQMLIEEGRPDLHWVCINDHYVIEPRRA